jgi:hypothetical protein
MAGQRITKRVVDSLKIEPREYAIWDAVAGLRGARASQRRHVLRRGLQIRWNSNPILTIVNPNNVAPCGYSLKWGGRVPSTGWRPANWTVPSITSNNLRNNGEPSGASVVWL